MNPVQPLPAQASSDVGRRVVSLAGWAVLATLLAACDAAPEMEEELLRPVRYLTIEDTVAGRSRTFSGTLKSTRESRLSFKVAGTVTELPVQIGQRLAPGDLIARLDSDSFALQVEQAQASLVEAQAGERNAQANYDRTKGLYANDNASLNELDAARASAEAAAAQVRAATKALEIFCHDSIAWVSLFLLFVGMVRISFTGFV